MDVFFAHIMKSSCLLFVFLLIYYAFLKKETFFTGNRFFLMIGILTSLLLPFINITKTIYVEAAPASSFEISQIQSIISNSEIAKPFDWYSILLVIYLFGATYFTCRLIWQLRAIRKIKNTSEVVREDNLYHVRTPKQISPFSFFNHIFYHPNQYSQGDLQTILTHEKVHAKGLHSFDILFTEVMCILQWFNPVVWFYKSMVKQNLEFLADAKTCSRESDKRNYQYLMLRQAVRNHKITIVNPFFNSIIKKRIVMLNQNQSRPVNLFKFFMVLPFLVLFLVSFNSKEVVKFSPESSLENSKNDNRPTFKSPLHQRDILRISSRFGIAKSPFSAKMEKHTGIDIVAKAGKDVLSSAPGTVRVSDKNTTNGNYIVVEHTDGYSSKYLHLKDRSVIQGEKVEAGKIIGHVGNTGKSTGTHLHFEILKSGEAMNPEIMVPFKTNQKAINSKNTALKKIELIIDKNTTDVELEEIKEDLKKDDIDFSYTLVHNEKKEIVAISIQISGKDKNGGTFNSNYSSSDNKAIKPLVILIDPKHNLVSIGAKDAHKQTGISINSDDNHVWISSDGKKPKQICIQKENGKKVISIDEKEVSEEELDAMHVHTGDSSSVFVHADSEDHDIKVLSKKGNSFFFINKDGDGEPLYFIDGEESSSKKVKRLNPEVIESIDVSKGEAVMKKYGKKAKDGVIEITTKKH